MKSSIPTEKDTLDSAQSVIELQGAPVDFRQLFSDSPVAFYTCDRHGYLNFFNQAAVNLWGKTPEPGKTLWCGSWKIFYPDGRPMPLEECPMAKTLKQAKPFENQRINIERPDHTYKSLLVFPRPILDEQQRLIGAHNTLVDITDQQKNEIKNATLSAIVESSDDAIVSKDLNGIITSWNFGAERIFGYTEKEILGKSITLLIPEPRLEEEEHIISSIKRGKRIDHFETIRKNKNGREIPVSITVSPIKDSSGKVVGASKIARDISERLKGEERQARLSAIVESSDDAIISKDLNGTIMSWNAGAEKIFGYSEKEVIGKSITMLIPEDRMAEEMRILKNIRSGKRIDHFETIRKDKNGMQIIVSITVSPVKDGQGNIIGASKVARDISARVKAQAEIEKYTRNLEILNSIGKSISEDLDLQVVMQRVTDATTKLTGAAFGAFFYNTVDEQGKSCRLYTLSGAPREAFEKFGMPRHTDVFHPTFVEKSIVRVDDITKDSRYGHNQPHNGMPLGHLPVVSYLAVPVVSKSGSVIGGLLFGHPEKGVFNAEQEEMVVNIAAQAAFSLDNSRLFEQVKSLSEKKDEFIALASHELKTPLTTVKGYLQVLGKKEQDKMSQLFLNKSLEQVDKLNKLVEDLLNMSRIEAGKLEFTSEVFDIRQMLLDFTETFSYSQQTHKLIYNLGTAPAIVEGDRHRIEQVINNLLSNAVKYSPKADKVYLNLDIIDQKIMVKVRDEGIGLTPEQQNQLFTRFYRAESTKGIKGLGLGLYLARQIIDRHNGTIKVKSKIGEGSEFFFTLPLKDDKGKDITTGPFT